MATKQFETGKPINITLGPDVRFMWPYLFEKRPNDDGDDKYEVTIQIPHTNKKAIALFDAAIDEAIDRGYSGELGDKSTFKKNTKESSLRIPLKDGDDKADDEYADLFTGYMYATAKNGKRRPSVLDANGQQILDPDELYSGCIGAVSLTIYPYANKSQGIGVQVNHVMILDEGERISGGAVSAEEAFADYVSSGRTSDRKPSRSRSRDEDINDEPRRGSARSRSRDDDDDDNRRPARGKSSRGRGSDDPMFD